MSVLSIITEAVLLLPLLLIIVATTMIIPNKAQTFDAQTNSEQIYRSLENRRMATATSSTPPSTHHGDSGNSTSSGNSGSGGSSSENRHWPIYLGISLATVVIVLASLFLCRSPSTNSVIRRVTPTTAAHQTSGLSGVAILDGQRNRNNNASFMAQTPGEINESGLLRGITPTIVSSRFSLTASPDCSLKNANFYDELPPPYSRTCSP